MYFKKFILNVYNNYRMDKLPNELLLDLLIKMDHKDMLNFIRLNKTINQKFNDNMEYIYKKRIQNEFSCIDSVEDVYQILHNSGKEYYQYCQESSIINSKDCKNVISQLKIINNIRDVNKKVIMIIEIFYKIQDCRVYLDKLMPNYKETILSKLEQLDQQIKILVGIKKDIKNKWDKFFAEQIKKYE